MQTDPPTGSGDQDQRFLDTPPDPARSLRVPLWAGIGSLASAMALAAVVVPPLILSADDSGPEMAQENRIPSIALPTPTLVNPAGTSPAASPEANQTASQDPSPPRNPGRPAPSPKPSDPPQTGPAVPFRPINVEAEASGNLTGDGAQIADCAACHGGARVRYLGRLTVYVDVPVAGRRTVTVYYTTGQPRELSVAINDDAVGTFDVNGADWESPKSIEFDATIPAGRVAMRFYGANHANAPDIDKVTIS
ncbi:hypothetical protein [Phytohabitans kaempferiae]|uniref:CBM6 domain-containing protein n=1 Tax=Phytohabitans kaempferiae TaxID=1620943 RepID=A0ABV6LXM5_9ACTN